MTFMTFLACEAHRLLGATAKHDRDASSAALGRARGDCAEYGHETSP
ncbi:MAG: hypothetical protein H7346_25495 [Burkholderiaceae bacterium]|nr:hypothetical protein [Burkholderiaceae bacterium]